MKKIFLLLLTVMSVTFALAQKKKEQGTKTVKVISSDIRWWGHKIVKSEATTHTGFVKLKNGRFDINDDRILGGEFTIDMRSLSNTDLEGEDQVKLTNDLKSVNFFEVKKYPIATFVITKMLPAKDPVYDYTVVGNLTLKGVRKTISFPAKIHRVKTAMVFESAKFSINRQDFKVFYKSSIKDYLIKDDVDVQIMLETK